MSRRKSELPPNNRSQSISEEGSPLHSRGSVIVITLRKTLLAAIARATSACLSGPQYGQTKALHGGDQTNDIEPV
jgi:hypothetical protein